MSVFQLDLYGELFIRVLFFVAFGIFIVKPLKPSHTERNAYFSTFLAFIFAKWFVILALNPSYEEYKNFFLGAGIFGNIVGYFSLFALFHSVFNIQRPFRDVPVRPGSKRVDNLNHGNTEGHLEG